ncbi:aldehyde dehydrogenase family protein, partial [Arthrobacter sp. JCM 19049]|uniref:aldehyde dehydrogenase family protein n=1 Tax=Arthrobacter sp. JCM 19049 TaxID=1460643 RepID=UPI002436C420
MTEPHTLTSPQFLDQLPSELFIGGQWREGTSQRTLRTTNPFDDTLLAEIRQASTADVDAAYQAAADASRAGPACLR